MQDATANDRLPRDLIGQSDIRRAINVGAKNYDASGAKQADFLVHLVVASPALFALIQCQWHQKRRLQLHPPGRRRPSSLDRKGSSRPADPETINSAPRCQSEPLAPLDLSLDPGPIETPAAWSFLPAAQQATSPFTQWQTTPQTIQTLDLLGGFSYQVTGASGESDPWLLRHCKFNDRGFRLFHQVHFRNAGGVPLDEKIPVHFLVSADALYQSAKEKTGILSREGAAREELDALISPGCGQRLARLYVVLALSPVRRAS